MAETYKRLGSGLGASSASTWVTLYGPVPSSTSAVVSSIVICNQAATSATYRIGYNNSSAAFSANDYLIFGATIAANDTVILTIGVTMAAGSYLGFSASTATVNAVAFGTEIT